MSPGTVSGGEWVDQFEPLGPVWRPAPYAIVLHRLADGLPLNFGGEPITGALCGASALVREQARHGPGNWQNWPQCQECHQATVSGV